MYNNRRNPLSRRRRERTASAPWARRYDPGNFAPPAFPARARAQGEADETWPTVSTRPA